MQMSSVGFTEAFKGGNAKTAHWREKKTNLSASNLPEQL